MCGGPGRNKSVMRALCLYSVYVLSVFPICSFSFSFSFSEFFLFLSDVIFCSGAVALACGVVRAVVAAICFCIFCGFRVLFCVCQLHLRFLQDCAGLQGWTTIWNRFQVWQEMAIQWDHGDCAALWMQLWAPATFDSCFECKCWDDLVFRSHALSSATNLLLL